MKLKPTKELQNSCKNFVLVNNFHKEEIKYLIAQAAYQYKHHLETKPEQVAYYYRSATRCLISSIEASCFHLRDITLSLTDVELAACFSEPEILKIKNLKRNKSDPTKLVRFYDNTKDYVSNSFKYFSRAFAPNFMLDKGQGWSNFLEALDVRNEITHPKGRESLTVALTSSNTLKATSQWFNEELNRVLSHAGAENSFMRY